jgi:Methyltransferase domain
MYVWAFRYFHQHLPEHIKAHRRYFAKDRRGFGEEAFHAMWFLLIKEYRIRSFLEIGVYRGQTLSLLALLHKTFGIKGEVVGISPFTEEGDSVSVYKPHIDYYKDTLVHFNYFGLAKPRLLRARSTDKAALEVISEKLWDCIYIDGNHDYAVVKADWYNCSSNVKRGGFIVLDDSALFTAYQPPVFASKGHPGPSRVAEEVDRASFKEIIRVGHNRVFQKA